MSADDAYLHGPPLCLAWAAPLGGLASLASATAGDRRGWLLRGRRDEGPGAEALAEAERLAASIACIAAPGLRVCWSAGGEPGAGRGPREIHLDRSLLTPRRGWDLGHRIDALMGMTLHDAAHAARTPHDYRATLMEEARAAGIAGPPDASGARTDEPVAPLLALFLLVETVHTGAWLDAEFPGFRGYRAALWLWRIPAADVDRRLGALRGRPTFGALLDGLITLVAGRSALDAAPRAMRPLLETITTALDTITARSSLAHRYGLALALYTLLRDLFARDPENRSGGVPRWHGTGQDERDSVAVLEPPHERPGLADEDLEGRQAALEALAAIAGNGLDPEEARDGLSPEQLRAVEGLREGGERGRGAGAGDDPNEKESPSFVRHRHLRLPGARPMRLVTPPIGPDARVRYEASYRTMRGQADALRQVLTFRLAERRHATRGHSSGQLDEQALYRVAGGDASVFQRRAVESAPDQDLCILLDESASMGAGQRHARSTAILFHHALRGLPGVRHWIFGFSGFGSAIALYRYISPSRADLQQPARLGAVRSREATPLAEAVAGAAEAMLTEGRGQERLMIVVTDGQPDDLEGTRQALRAAESRGITILGLGIAADATAARDLFAHFTMYEDVATLPRKVGAILRRVVGQVP